jgi:Beta-propeller repeat
MDFREKTLMTYSTRFLLLIELSLGWAVASQRQLPAYFAENKGQAAADVRFVLRKEGGTASFSGTGIAIDLPSGAPLRVHFEKPLPSLVVEGRQKLAAKANFFEGSDRAKWQSGVALYEQIAYRELWPGVEAVYTTSSQYFKSEFRVAKGYDAGVIRWSYGPNSILRVEKDGSLAVRQGEDTVYEAAPEIYQMIGDKRVPVRGEYQVSADGIAGFRLGEYDQDRELVIDPVITFSSLLGGVGQDNGTAIATDAYGNMIIAGWATSSNFPATGAARQRISGGGVDAFVAKFGGSGNNLIFCTYLGGSGDDRAFGVAVDHSGSVYVTGRTSSSNFPVTAGVQRTFGGVKDAFVTKLNDSGSQIIYSTYLGGNDVDTGNGIAVDAQGYAYVIGDTVSVNFPVINGYKSQLTGGQDAFVARLNPAGTLLMFSTYLGGHGIDHGAAITVNASGYIFITGSTYSVDFPVSFPVQQFSGGNQDAFVAELTPGGNVLVFSTYLGGSGGTSGLSEEGTGIVLDSAGNIFVVGTTSSLNFPVTSGALQSTFGGGNTDAFVVQYDPTGRSITYASYLGGSGLEAGNGIAVDAFGYVTAVGYTSSGDFPNVRAIQKNYAGNYDGFVTKFHFSGHTWTLVNSTYLGGNGSDSAAGVVVDNLGNALVTGYTSSTDFPTQALAVNGSALYQPYNYGTANAFATKISNPYSVGASYAFPAYNFVRLDVAADSTYDGHTYTGLFNYWGNFGDTVIMGDWTHSGSIRSGSFRQGLWILDTNGNGVIDSGDRQFTFGQAGDIPMVGDWDGTGTLKAGLFRNGTWILDYSGHMQGVSTGQADKTFTYGLGTDIPIVGDWTGTGSTKIGVFRSSFWILDANGDFNLTSADPFFVFGQAGDTPMTGDWDGSGISHPCIIRNYRWYLNYQWNNETGALGSAGTELSFSYGGSGLTMLMGNYFSR